MSLTPINLHKPLGSSNAIPALSTVTAVIALVILITVVSGVHPRVVALAWPAAHQAVPLMSTATVSLISTMRIRLVQSLVLSQ